MDFTLSEAQIAARDLAAQLFTGLATTDRVKAVEATDDRFDHDLWKALADAGLLALVVPEAHGGSGFGVIEAGLVLEQQGRRVAPIPLCSTVAGALTLAAYGTDAQQAKWLPGVASGAVILATALDEAGGNDPFTSSVVALPVGAAGGAGAGWVLTGVKPAVAAAHVADAILVPAHLSDGALGVFIVAQGAPGLSATMAVSTNRQILSTLTFDSVSVGVDSLIGFPAATASDGAALTYLVYATIVMLAAQQVGIVEEVTALAAAYTSTRQQFGKPLSTFQGVSHRLADNYINTEAMRVTMQAAAWRIANRLDATSEVMVAKWWASEGGHRAIHGAQHVHGGMGADVEYPSHRYFLWGKQIEMAMGGASAWLARLGAVLAAQAVCVGGSSTGTAVVGGSSTGTAVVGGSSTGAHDHRGREGRQE